METKLNRTNSIQFWSSFQVFGLKRKSNVISWLKETDLCVQEDTVDSSRQWSRKRRSRDRDYIPEYAIAEMYRRLQMRISLKHFKLTLFYMSFSWAGLGPSPIAEHEDLGWQL